ncbi:retrotransposon protein [Tanacetum coccineum]
MVSHGLWKIRSPVYPLHDLDSYDKLSTLKIHHNGRFTRPPGRRYHLGEISYVDLIDCHLFSNEEYVAMLDGLGLGDGRLLFSHFKTPCTSLDDRLVPLMADEDVVKLLEYVPRFREVDVYVEEDVLVVVLIQIMSKNLFSSYKAYNGDNVIFGSNLRGNIIDKGQICDNKCRVTFSEHNSEITKDGKVIDRGIRKKGLYVMKLGNKPKDKICLAAIDENSTLWHRRLGHANMHLIQSLTSKELVRKLLKLKFDQHFCDACKIGKQAHASHKAKNIVSTTRCLELFHMDLFGPSAVRSYGGNL